MDVCRICLINKSDKDIFQLQTVRNCNEKSFVDVLLFCLEIKVVQDSKVSTKLCLNCYKKVLSFHKFKSLALKNDEYWKSLLKEISVENEIFIKDDIKTEQLSLSDDSQGASVKEELKDDNLHLKNEEEEDTTHEYDTDDEFLSVIKKIKYEYVENEPKENAPVKRKKNKAASKADIKIVKQMCEECGKTVKNLKTHSYMHLPVGSRKRIKCHSCDKTFSTHSARYKHNKIKHLGIRQKCTLCNKDVTNIKQHHRVVHNRASLPFECVPCGRRFISKSSLDVHMTTHTKDRPHACIVCEKKFSTKGLMLLHKRQVHDKEKSHLCQLCSKSFFKKYHLQVHLRSHSKEKPYECPDCGKFFSSCSTMKSHRQIHGEVKSFACSLCNMTFMKKTYLNVHMISHTKEKRHPCQYCGVKFGRSDHRKRHERTAHEQNLMVTSYVGDQLKVTEK